MSLWSNSNEIGRRAMSWPRRSTMDRGSSTSVTTRFVEIHSGYAPAGVSLSEAFTEAFGAALPEDLNASHQLVVVASELDSSTERIVGYLEQLSVPVNAVFFRYLKDGDHEYLMRSWLRDPSEVEARAGPRSKAGTMERTGLLRFVWGWGTSPVDRRRALWLRRGRTGG